MAADRGRMVSWIYCIPVLLLTDVMLYVRYWQQFAQRYYFIDYGFTTGWMMAYKLRSGR